MLFSEAQHTVLFNNQTHTSHRKEVTDKVHSLTHGETITIPK